MLSGVKFISRDDLPKARDEDDDDSVTYKKKLGSKRGNDGRRKKKSSHRSDTSDDDDDDLVRIKKRSKRSKKWYSSDEHSSESSDTESENDSYDGRGGKKRKKGKTNRNGSGDSQESESRFGEDIDIVRKEMGLDWMQKPADRKASVIVESQPEETPAQEMPRVNPRELNPYLRNNGSGYPEEANEKTTGRDSLLSSSLVGDGGASWRLKALKRAQEQAAREGRKLEEVVEERWGSLGQLAVSAVSHTAAPSRAHLHAIRNRKRGVTIDNENMSDCQNEKNLDLSDGRSYLKDVSVCNPKMRAPKVHDSLSWGKRKGQNMTTKNDSIIAAAASSLNKFTDDGSFMSNFLNNQNDNTGEAAGSFTEEEANPNLKAETAEVSTPVKEQLSANQLAAKALQLRMKGRHEEAEKLMEEAANAKAKLAAGETLGGVHTYFGRASRHAIQDVSARKKEDDADRNLAQTIIRNKKYSVSGQADDEYDYELAPSKMSRKKGGGDGHKASERNNNAQHFLTQQERCIFCFENPNRPKHLVLSIANFTYLMLPQRRPVVPGHCCILPLQHESATRTVDDNVWEEIRNFKKCLIMMFAQQEKELVFLETVVGLAKQRRHCLIECIPLPQEIAKEAPLYFKKAIDEAEDEWSQHNAKKLIDTSEKGLRGSIPKDFPYFHVEFGLNKGFVHVIDDEKQFNGSLGLNVVRGMLRLPEEDMYRHRRHEPVETQKQAAANFLRDWEPFDWTKQLD